MTVGTICGFRTTAGVLAGLRGVRSGVPHCSEPLQKTRMVLCEKHFYVAMFPDDLCKSLKSKNATTTASLLLQESKGRKASVGFREAGASGKHAAKRGGGWGPGDSGTESRRGGG